MDARTVRVGRRNAAFQILESLASNRQKRHQSRTFLVEGVLPITRALAHGWRFAGVIHAEGAALSSWASDVIARAAAPVRFELAPVLLAALSRKEETSELLAVLEMPADSLARIDRRTDLLVAVVDRPARPGNLGTLIRSCDAFGAQGVIVSGHAADIYDPAAITASRGSLFALPVVRVPSHGDVRAWLEEIRRALPSIRVVGADEGADLDAFDHDFVAPTVLVLGNEAQGLSRAYRELCDVHVRIPMSGSASSLNVGVAASVVLYEAVRQRRVAARASGTATFER